MLEVRQAQSLSKSIFQPVRDIGTSTLLTSYAITPFQISIALLFAPKDSPRYTVGEDPTSHPRTPAKTWMLSTLLTGKSILLFQFTHSPDTASEITKMVLTYFTWLISKLGLGRKV